MKWWALALRLTGIGWYVAVCVLVGVVGGIWLDKKLRTIPLFTLLGTVLGTSAAFYGIYRIVAPLMNVNKRNREDGRS